MFKEQKNQVFIFGIVAILGILLVTPTAKAELDIDWVWITSSINFLDGLPKGTEPWCFKIQVQLADTGSVHHIDVTKPGASTPFTLDPGPGGYWDLWPPPNYSSLADLRDDYPEGIYTFEFLDIDDVLVKTVNLDYSGISETDSPVDFTYPSYNGQMGIRTNPTFTWTVDSSAGDALMMGLRDVIIGDELYWEAPVSMTTSSWTPGPLQAGREYELDVSVCRVKNWGGGPGFPTMTVDVDQFEYALMIEFLNEIHFTTAPPSALSGLVYMPQDYPDIGYSLDEADLVYFYSFDFVPSYNLTTGGWSIHMPTDWVYFDWPFYYELDPGILWFAFPPKSGLWVYHFSTGQWEMLRQPPIPK